MKKCIIIGAGDFSGLHPEFTADYIIAADGGYIQLECESVTADLLIGDFDSLDTSEYPALADSIEVMRYPPEKDFSDLELAVDEAVRRGFDCFYIYGALGKRLDHTFANVAVLTSIAQRGLTGYLIGENEIITAVTDGKLTIDRERIGAGDFISVFPAGEQASGVYLKGLKYPLNDAVLTCRSTHGLSNEFLNVGRGDPDAPPIVPTIEVKNGTLIVVINF